MKWNVIVNALLCLDGRFTSGPVDIRSYKGSADATYTLVL